MPVTDGPGALDLLDANAVVAAAVDAGADALHPGFGFLAESAALAEAVIAARIRWVGPPPTAIRTIRSLPDFPIQSLRGGVSRPIYRSLEVSPITAWLVARTARRQRCMCR